MMYHILSFEFRTFQVGQGSHAYTRYIHSTYIPHTATCNLTSNEVIHSWIRFCIIQQILAIVDAIYLIQIHIYIYWVENTTFVLGATISIS